MFATAQPSSFPWTILIGIGSRGMRAADVPWTAAIASRKAEASIVTNIVSEERLDERKVER